MHAGSIYWIILFCIISFLVPSRMTLSWVLKSIPSRRRSNSRFLLGRHPLQSPRSQPGFYWPERYPDAENSGRHLSEGPAVDTTISDEKFYAHVLIKQDGLGVREAISQAAGKVVGQDADDICSGSVTLPSKVQKLTPLQLLLLGSVWYMPREEVEHNNNRSPDEPHSLMHKPRRLSLANHTMSLKEGDYMRIHHTPRRFTKVYEQIWEERICTNHSSSSSSGGSNGTRTNDLNSTIVHVGDGFYIINKPPLVPVHATVDNAVENAVHQIASHNPHREYVATTQRIDINTSGLLVVATKPEFAAYFSSLLRRKTKTTLKQGQTGEPLANRTAEASAKTNSSAPVEVTNIEKEYKCLVCIKDTDSSTVLDSWENLKGLEGTVVRHYLEASERAPKRFEVSLPTGDGGVMGEDENGRKWFECLLKVRRVSPLIPVETPRCQLAQSLWARQVITSVPGGTKAVCEVGIQLLTGRTHQIRGQLAKLGYPIVGDEQYGGAIPKKKGNDESGIAGEDHAQLLALQCCQLSFRDADYKETYNRKRKRDILQGFPSERWVSAELHSSWWTEYIEAAPNADDDGRPIGPTAATTSAADLELLRRQKERRSRSLSLVEDDEFASGRADLLPPSVQLSPGVNKYVLIEVQGKGPEEVRWFVKSASPGECGGPYHANVAEDVIEWIRAAGFERIAVTGGGRIDFEPASGRAHVYGFSYGYGKGDHAKAAELIDAHYDQEGKGSGGGGVLVKASFDDSDSLY